MIDLESNTNHSAVKYIENSIVGKEWLTSDHMSNVDKLMLDAGYSVNGFQDSLLAPVFQKGRWHIPANGFSSKIHHLSIFITIAKNTG